MGFWVLNFNRLLFTYHRQTLTTTWKRLNLSSKFIAHGGREFATVVQEAFTNTVSLHPPIHTATSCMCRWAEKEFKEINDLPIFACSHFLRDSVLKSRDITLPTKVHIIKAMVFPVVMYGCESWTIKMAECQRIDAFELWCWRRLLRVPWTARRSNQEINPQYSLEGLMLKLKLPYFGHLVWRAHSLEKSLMLGKIEGRRRRGWQRMRQLGGITNSMDMSLSKVQGMVKDREAWHASVLGVEKSQTLLNNNSKQQSSNLNLVWLQSSCLFSYAIRSCGGQGDNTGKEYWYHVVESLVLKSLLRQVRTHWKF